jgi:hypothetical protein
MLIQALAIAPILGMWSWLVSVRPVLLSWQYRLPPQSDDQYFPAVGGGPLTDSVQPFLHPIQATAYPLEVANWNENPIIPLADGRSNTHLMLEVVSPQAAGYSHTEVDPVVLMRFPDVIERGSRYQSCISRLMGRPSDTVTTSVLIDHQALPRLHRQSLTNVQRRFTPTLGFTDGITPTSWGTYTLPHPVLETVCSDSYIFMPIVGDTRLPDGRWEITSNTYPSSAHQDYHTRICNIRPYPLAPLSGRSPPCTRHQRPIFDSRDQLLGFVNPSRVVGHQLFNRDQPSSYQTALQFRCSLRNPVP